jgi:hypothetical protein
LELGGDRRGSAWRKTMETEVGNGKEVGWRLPSRTDGV